MARLEDLSIEEIRKRYVEGTDPISAQALTRLHELRSRLFAAEARDALAAFEAELKSRAKELSERECQTLRLLTARRWKLLA